jgi:hypothetical protein
MAGLPWLKVASDWKGSKKAIRLRVFLQDEWAWAYAVSLWMWTAQHEGDGTIAGPGCLEVIADAAGWKGDPKHFAECMVRAGLLDEVSDGYYVHDWHDYAGAHIEKADKERARLKAYRERTRTTRVQNAYVQPSSTYVHGERERETETEASLSQAQPPTASVWPPNLTPLASLVKALEEGGWVADPPKKHGLREAAGTIVTRDGLEVCAERLLAMVRSERAAGREPEPGLGWHMDTLNGAPMRRPEPQRHGTTRRGEAWEPVVEQPRRKMDPYTGKEIPS